MAGNVGASRVQTSWPMARKKVGKARRNSVWAARKSASRRPSIVRRRSRSSLTVGSALEAVQHLESELVAAEGRHQVGALDAVAHGEQHLARDLDAFLPRGVAA